MFSISRFPYTGKPVYCFLQTGEMPPILLVTFFPNSTLFFWEEGPRLRWYRWTIHSKAKNILCFVLCPFGHNSQLCVCFTDCYQVRTEEAPQRARGSSDTGLQLCCDIRQIFESATALHCSVPVQPSWNLYTAKMCLDVPSFVTAGIWGRGNGCGPCVQCRYQLSTAKVNLRSVISATSGCLQGTEMLFWAVCRGSAQQFPCYVHVLQMLPSDSCHPAPTPTLPAPLLTSLYVLPGVSLLRELSVSFGQGSSQTEVFSTAIYLIVEAREEAVQNREQSGSPVPKHDRCSLCSASREHFQNESWPRFERRW